MLRDKLDGGADFLPLGTVNHLYRYFGICTEFAAVL